MKKADHTNSDKLLNNDELSAIEGDSSMTPSNKIKFQNIIKLDSLG